MNKLSPFKRTPNILYTVESSIYLGRFLEWLEVRPSATVWKLDTVEKQPLKILIFQNFRKQ